MPQIKETKIKESIKKEEKIAKAKKIIKKENKKDKEIEKPISKKIKYIEAVGRRKTAVARVRIFTKGEKTFLVNEKPLENFFSLLELQQIAQIPLEKMRCLDKFRVTVKVKGGGQKAQAEAIRQGVTRALVLFNLNFKKKLKKAGYLTRDPRMKERKKFGLKRARKSPQWQKR